MDFSEIIIEEIENYLDETYQSVSEIRKLSKNIVEIVSKSILSELNKYGSIKYFRTVHFEDINSNEYNELRNFIQDANILINFKDRGDKTTGGNYHTMVGGGWEYDPNYQFTINVFVNELLGEIWLINARYHENKNISERDIYHKVYRLVNNILIHELQHAFDDYRSKNKIFQSKQHDKYFKMADNIKSKVEKDKLDFKEKAQQELRYLRLDSEIWARFSQAIDEIGFTDIDYGVKDRIILKMIPLGDVIKQFISKFGNFRQMTEKQKRVLIRKVSQFWHYEKDKLESENK